MEAQNINLQNYRGTKSSVFTGRPQGEDARTHLDLDKLDTTKNKYIFIIPAGTTAITPSFFLGLLYKSIKDLGYDAYRQKYNFEFQDLDSEIVAILQENIFEGERYAINSIDKKIGVRRS